jgi:hypothetical protein
MLGCAGFMAGCDSGTQIPLAKVDKPPDAVTKSKGDVKIPSTASPTDANARRK